MGNQPGGEAVLAIDFAALARPTSLDSPDSLGFDGAVQLALETLSGGREHTDESERKLESKNKVAALKWLVDRALDPSTAAQAQYTTIYTNRW